MHVADEIAVAIVDASAQQLQNAPPFGDQGDIDVVVLDDDTACDMLGGSGSIRANGQTTSNKPRSKQFHTLRISRYRLPETSGEETEEAAR